MMVIFSLYLDFCFPLCFFLFQVLAQDGWYRFESFIGLEHFKHLNLLLNERVNETRNPEHKVGLFLMDSHIMMLTLYVLFIECSKKKGSYYLLCRKVVFNMLDTVKPIDFIILINVNIE